MQEPAIMQTESGALDSAAPWSPIKRLAFRFCFVYFGLYILVTQMLSTLLLAPSMDVPEIGTLWPLRPIISWTASRIFHHQALLVVTGSGSGDKTFDWVEAFCLFAIAFLVIVLWSWLDRRRPNYSSLDKWFYLFVRFAVGTTMFAYGFDKAIPLQMPYPYLFRLLEPLGNFSPMGILWTSVGSSPADEIRGLRRNSGRLAHPDPTHSNAWRVGVPRRHDTRAALPPSAGALPGASLGVDPYYSWGGPFSGPFCSKP